MQAHRELIIEPIGLDVETLPRPIVWSDLINASMAAVSSASDGARARDRFDTAESGQNQRAHQR